MPCEFKTVRLSGEHLDGVAELERLCFADPWSADSLGLLLGERAMGLVALCDCRVVGYVGMMCVLDEGQITNICVHPEYRRSGIGRALMDSLEDYSRRNGIIYLSLEVRESNLAARTLYAGCGWVESGMRKGFYSHPTENAVIMTRELS
ncbi:MAG: ribosomal protein S18-alanine N-acetyltransferase [Clostridia bacterium]|nr:ribosomal protein S18-alanine N-acetyltransferase [Clostridia bacterium]